MGGARIRGIGCPVHGVSGCNVFICETRAVHLRAEVEEKLALGFEMQGEIYAHPPEQWTCVF